MVNHTDEAEGEKRFFKELREKLKKIVKKERKLKNSRGIERHVL